MAIEDTELIKYPRNPEYFYHCGVSNLQMKKYKRAIELFDRAWELNEKDIQLFGDTLHQRALAYFHTQNHKAKILDIHGVEALSKGRNKEAVEDKKIFPKNFKRSSLRALPTIP